MIKLFILLSLFIKKYLFHKQIIYFSREMEERFNKLIYNHNPLH